MKVLVVGLALFLTGCSELRTLTMTKEEQRLYGQLKITDYCGRQSDHVCIRP